MTCSFTSSLPILKIPITELINNLHCYLQGKVDLRAKRTIPRLLAMISFLGSISIGSALALPTASQQVMAWSRMKSQDAICDFPKDIKQVIAQYGFNAKQAGKGELDDKQIQEIMRKGIVQTSRVYQDTIKDLGKDKGGAYFLCSHASRTAESHWLVEVSNEGFFNCNS